METEDRPLSVVPISLEEGQEEIWEAQGWEECEVRPLPDDTVRGLAVDMIHLGAIRMGQNGL